MKYIYHFLFPTNLSSNGRSAFLLSLRLLFGIMLMWHGVIKWANFSTLASTFPDPFNIGPQFSLLLAIFAELFCSIFFIFGFLYRLVLLPMIFTMAIAFFVIHDGSIGQGGELDFIYLIMFAILYIVGPGRFSFDHVISSQYLKQNHYMLSHL
jgi:putative oxidoreductase